MKKKTEKLEDMFNETKVFDEFLFKKQIINTIAVETEYKGTDINTALSWIEDVLRDYKEELENDK